MTDATPQLVKTTFHNESLDYSAIGLLRNPLASFTSRNQTSPQPYESLEFNDNHTNFFDAGEISGINETVSALYRTDHVIDSGLTAMLNRLTVSNWGSHSSDFGGVLESFVVQQLICQAGWQGHDLSFSHYRDKEKVEVDLVIERGHEVWGVEVKRAATVKNEDGAGLAKLAAQSGAWFKGGILLYSGINCLPINVHNCYAVPLDRLWV